MPLGHPEGLLKAVEAALGHPDPVLRPVDLGKLAGGALGVFPG